MATMIKECIQNGQEDEKPSLIGEQCFANQLMKFQWRMTSMDVVKMDPLAWYACHNRQTLFLDDAEISKESFIVRDRMVEKKVGAIFHPSVTMNGKTFRGDYSDPN